MAKGKTIRLGQGQMALGATRRQESQYEPPLAPKKSDWHATDGGAPHPQLGLFPFESIREGQKRFARDVTMNLQRGGHLVAEAPTGIGKTAASLAPTLQHAIETQRTVLFLTSRQSQHRIAVDTLRNIQTLRGARFTLVDLVSKRDMCLREEAVDMHPGRFPDFCAYETRNKSCKFLGDVDEGTLRRLQAGVFHVEELMQASKEAGLCPHLVATTASTHAQVVVADYNHIFSDIRDRSLEKLGLDLQNLILVVDEAHNLPDRIRQNHTHRITPFLIEQVAQEARKHRFGDIVQDMEAMRKALAALVDRGQRDGAMEASRLGKEADVLRLEIDDLHEAFTQARSGGTLGLTRTLQDLIDDLGPLITKARKGTDQQVYSETLLETLDDWGRFRMGALRFIQVDDDGIALHLRLLDPSVAARRVFESVHASILMSGTLRPPETLRDVLGLDPARTQVRTYANPFPPENRMTLVDTGLSTRYKDRSADMWQKMAKTVADICEATSGNVAVFAPSYDLLREIKIALDPFRVEKELIEEIQGMSKQDRDEVLDRMRAAKKDQGGLLMGVLGGSFSEGVDFPDNLLSAVCVAGLPLPPPDLEVDATIGYFEQRFPGKGRLYAYIVPAMNKTLQAMGRGIRSGADRCAVVLMDFRYAQQPYRSFLPIEAAVTKDAAQVARRFLQAHGL